MKKKLIGFFIIITLVLSSTAYAEEPLHVNLESFTTATNSLDIFFNTNYEQEISSSQLSISLGGQELPIQTLEQVKSSDIGTTYLFLVDVSGSIKENKMVDMKALLGLITNQLNDNDNASIMLVGNDTILHPFEHDKEKIQKQIEAIESSSQDTNLYSAIIQALGVLSTNASVQAKKCLIVLSDSADDFITGFTREEVNTKVEQSNIPVFTVAMLSEKASSTLIDSSKIFGSFARLSAGGEAFAYGLDQISMEDISESIVKKMQEGYIVTTDIRGLTLRDGQSYLEIILNIDNYGTAKDGYTMTTFLIQDQIKPTSEITPEATPKPSAMPEEIEESSSDNVNHQNNGSIIIVLIAGIFSILIIVLFLVFIIRRKKKQKQSVAAIADEIQGDRKRNQKIELNSKGIMDKLELRFTKVGLREGETYKVFLDKELIIGRDPGKAQYVFEQDELLSSQHCKITKENGRLYLKDMQSTNGTYLNGIPVTQEYLLEQDDIIMIGSMELRVNWSEETRK